MTQVLTPYKIYIIYFTRLSVDYCGPWKMSFSVSMAARGLLTALTVLVLVHQTSTAEDTHHHCPPSSCGNIRTISYPFRLESDPENCGDQRYGLSCENNQTVLYLYNRSRYYVREIDYDNFTIRLVDTGFLNDTDSLPRYPVNIINFSSRVRDPFQINRGPRFSVIIIFVKCENPVKSRYHLNISGCFEDGVYSSNSSLPHSKKHRYALLGEHLWDLEDRCQIELMSSRPDLYDYDDLRNISCTDIQNELLRGFKLSWYQVYCGSCRISDCYVHSPTNVTCFKQGA